MRVCVIKKVGGKKGESRKETLCFVFTQGLGDEKATGKMHLKIHWRERER